MTRNGNNGASLGFENKLWEMADKLRGHMDPGEYKHVALGLIFLKYISDAFQEKYEELKARLDDQFDEARRLEAETRRIRRCWGMGVSAAYSAETGIR